MPSPPNSTRRIVIVEDDPDVREHFIDIISRASDLDIAGVADCLAQARNLLELRPALFLIDIGLPDGSGLDFIPEIKASGDARILVVTTFGDRETVVSALGAGADGYLLKDSSPQVILEGISVTLDGGAPISAAAAVYLLERLRGGVALQAPIGNDEKLTSRETELLRMFARGSSYKEAARELGISPLTVGNHVKAIYRKLEVHSRGEAVYAALKSGKLDLG
jgi:DNA-binding NarL/FixJ family response regulator